MGTWSTELLGNDSALDTLGDIARGEFSFADLAEELGADYIDSDAGVAVLTLIEVALAVRGERELPEDDENVLIIENARALIDDERAGWLLAQVDRVLGPGSEVYELWHEAGHETLHEWLSNANAAVSDLQRVLGSSLSLDATSGSAEDDDDLDLGPKHPAFAAHFRDPVYDDPAHDFAPFGNDEGADLLAEWVERIDELHSGSTLTQLAPEWFEDGPLLPADLNEDDVDLNDVVIGAGFTLLRLTGQIDEAGRALLLRALDMRDRTYGRHPETQQMRSDLLTFGQAQQV